VRGTSSLLIASISQVLKRLALLCLLLGFATPAQAQQPAVPGAAARPSAAQAYREVLTWASGRTDSAYLDDLYDRVERAAYRNNIFPEFALAVVAAEAKYGHGISWARNNSWTIYEMTTGRQARRLHVLDDLDTALSELHLIMSQSKRVEEVLHTYWCGPDGSFNKESYKDFAEAASKLWNALEPYVRERLQQEDRNKYTPEYYNQGSGEAPWAALAYGDLEGYRSALGSMPLLAAQLKTYPGHEERYARAVRRFNKGLSEAEATVIARSVLTYCEMTDWRVDPRLVMAVVRAESAFRPEAVSRTGAMGLGQLMPATASGFGIRNAFDPVQNLYVCVKYLEREIYRWRGSDNWLELVLASYNAGPGAVQRFGGVPPYQETRSYVTIVKRYLWEFAPELRGKL